jgi:hypothetical protein
MQGNYELNTSERALSKAATATLGFRVLVFRDGKWICQPVGEQRMGFGDTPQEAIDDCRSANIY